MEITINVGGPLVDAINNLAAALQSGVKAEHAIETAKSKAKKPAKVEAEKPVEEPSILAEDAAAAAEVEPTNSMPVPTTEDIQKLCRQISREQGPATVTEVINSFGVKFAKDVPSDQIGALYVALQAKLVD